MTPPKFIRFEQMTDAEKREHIRRVHQYDMPALDSFSTSSLRVLHADEHGTNPYTGRVRYLETPQPVEHTHDKPAARP